MALKYLGFFQKIQFMPQAILFILISIHIQIVENRGTHSRKPSVIHLYRRNHSSLLNQQSSLVGLFAAKTVGTQKFSPLSQKEVQVKFHRSVFNNELLIFSSIPALKI